MTFSERKSLVITRYSLLGIQTLPNVFHLIKRPVVLIAASFFFIVRSKERSNYSQCCRCDTPQHGVVCMAVQFGLRTVARLVRWLSSTAAKRVAFAACTYDDSVCTI